jgi:hypothetical protein
MMALRAFPKVKVSEQAVAAIVLRLLKLVALSKIFTASSPKCTFIKIAAKITPVFAQMV